MTKLGLCLAALVMVGCSGDDAPEERQTREGFCREWATAACSTEVISACQSTDAAECRLAQQSFCLDLVPSGFVDDHADSCIRAVRTAYADADLTASELRTVLQLGAPCHRLIQGSLEAGDSCASNLECDGPAGFQCVVKGADASGTCQVPRTVQPGLACSAPQETCTAGFYCNGDNCIGGKAVGASCAAQQECGDENYCGSDGECAARSSVNSPCSADHECSSGICYRFGAQGAACVDRIRLSPSEPLCDELR